MDKYNRAIVTIINEQKLIIGPLAVNVAQRSNGLRVVSETSIDIVGDPKIALSDLVQEYSKIFGATSIKVSRDALKRMSPNLSPEELPEILK